MSTHGTKRFRWAVATSSAAAAVVLGLGCSSDDVAEKLAESTGGDDTDVSIDSESGEVEIETDDGSMQFGNAEVPEGFPEGIPLPDDFELLSSMSSDVGGGDGFSLVGIVEGEVSEVFDSLATQFGDGGWTETDSGTVSMGGTTTRSASFDNADWEVILIIDETEGEITVTYAVSAASS